MLREIAFLLVTSLFFAMGFSWLGQPYLLGYIASGIFLGPLIQVLANSEIVPIIGDLGMIMLLFVIGMEFDLVKFKKIWQKSIAIVLLQITFSFIIAFLLRPILWLSIEYTFLIAFLLTLSSTAVVVKLLEQMGEFKSKSGSLIISILIVQDLAIVPMILILRSFCGQATLPSLGFSITLSIGLLASLIIYLGKESNKLLSPLKNIFNGNQEIMTLASMALCFGCAATSSAIGLSSAYGAFLAGLVVGSFGNKKEILDFAMPIGSMLIMMFFIAIGMRMNIDYILQNWLILFALSALLILAKIFMNYIVLRLMLFQPKKSIFVATMLSQASEFSFTFIAILTTAALLNAEQENLLNALVIISLTLGSVLPIAVQAWYKLYKRLK